MYWKGPGGVRRRIERALVGIVAPERERAAIANPAAVSVERGHDEAKRIAGREIHPRMGAKMNLGDDARRRDAVTRARRYRECRKESNQCRRGRPSSRHA